MRSDISLRHGLSLARASSLLVMGLVATACSSDSTRLDQMLTASTKVSPNQRAIIAKGGNMSQPYPGDVAQSVPVAVAAAPAKLAASVSRSNLPAPVMPALATQSPAEMHKASVQAVQNYRTKTTAKVAQRVVQAAPAYAKPKVKNGHLVLAPQPKAVDPLRKLALDNTPVGSIRPAAALVTAGVAPVKQATAAGWDTSKATNVVVRQDETLYNISRRYGVPVKAIMRANGITDPKSVGAGTTISIPRYSFSQSAPVSAPDNDPATRAARASRGMQGQARGKVAVPTMRSSATPPPVSAAPAPRVATAPPVLPKAKNSGRHTVQSGDTLYSISRRYGVTVNAMRDANGMNDNTVRLGQTLRIPAYGQRNGTILAQANKDSAITGSVERPSVKPKGTRKLAPKASFNNTIASRSTEQVATAAQTGVGSFRWPANGRVISKFGDTSPTGRNDGIDISLPVGTPIKASENGTVIYSGSELEDFGKLILLSHEGGWVSAYAHASAALVRRGDKVRRGQVIAKSGKTGNAKRPKLHFELRRNANPVNPLNHLSK